MITNISPREAELIRQIDEQGGQLAAWRDRAIAAEAELARLRAQEPVAWMDDFGNAFPLAANKGAGSWMDEHKRHWKPLYRAAPPAQPAEPVQRLSDERAAFEAWHNEYRTQELVRRDDTYYNTHVRCRWEGWQARAIESALQPGWRDIESAPKDGSTVIVGRDMGHFGFIRGYARWECSIDGLVPGWISCGFDPVNSNLGLAHPTHWQPIPPAPKATK